ncbi:RDD family protein [Reichenbachiella sp.]
MRRISTKPNIKNRIIATLIDYSIYLTFWGLYITNFGDPSSEGGYQVSGAKSLPLSVVWFIYFPLVESIRGQTLGHYIAGIKVVDVSGIPITILQSIKRRIIDPFDLVPFFGLIAYITIKNTDKNQRVGDIFAKTIVIGGESVNCQHCREKLTLSPEDTLAGIYNCPSCNNENKI